jgi:flavin reductase (DIM6/NTAB) family NADH-FMN oxidoreductase RutF
MSAHETSFKNAMAQWASGVTVVTSVHEGRNVGITASSFSSVSLEPPRILVCIAKHLFTHGVVTHSGVFAVSILGVEHLEWGMRFAGMFPEIEDRFAGINYTTAETGCPILPGALGWLDCRVAHAYDGGDHTIFVGEVIAAGAEEDGAPILYFHRTWRRLDDAALNL